MLVPKKLVGKEGSFNGDCSRITPAGIYSALAINAMGSSLYDRIQEHMRSAAEFRIGGPGVSGKLLKVSGDADGVANTSDSFLMFTDFNSVVDSENIEVTHVDYEGTAISDAIAMFYGTGDRSTPATPYAYFSTNLSSGQESYVLIKHVRDTDNLRYTRPVSLILEFIPDTDYADVIEVFSGETLTEIKDGTAETRNTLYTLKFGSNIKAAQVVAALNAYREDSIAVFTASMQSAGTFADEDMISLFDFYTDAVLTNTTVVLKFTGTCPGFILSSPQSFFNKYFNSGPSNKLNVLSYSITDEVKRFVNPGTYGFLIRDSEKAGAELSPSLLTPGDNYSFLYIPNRKAADHLIPSGSSTGVPSWFSSDNPLYAENHVSTVDLDTDVFFLPFCEVTDKSVEFMNGFSINIDSIQEPEIANVSHPGTYSPEMKSSRVRHDIKTTTDTWYTQMSELFNKFKTHLSYTSTASLTENESILKRMSEFVLGTAWYLNRLVVIDPALSSAKPAYPSINVFRTLQDAYSAGVLRPITTVLFIGSNGDGSTIDNLRLSAVVDIDYDFMAKLSGIRFAAVALPDDSTYTAAETGFSLEGCSLETTITILWHPDPATGLIDDLDFSGVYGVNLYVDITNDTSSDITVEDGWEHIYMQKSKFNWLNLFFVKTSEDDPAYELMFAAGLTNTIANLELKTGTVISESVTYYRSSIGYLEVGYVDRNLFSSVAPLSSGVDRVSVVQDVDTLVIAGAGINPNFVKNTVGYFPYLCLMLIAGNKVNTDVTYRQCLLPADFVSGHAMLDRMENNIIVFEGMGGSTYDSSEIIYQPAAFNLKLDIEAVSGSESRDKSLLRSLIHVDGVISNSDIILTIIDEQISKTAGAITYAWNTFNSDTFLPGAASEFPETFLFLDCGLYATNTGSSGSWVTTRQGRLSNTRIKIVFDEDSAIDDWNRQLFFASDLFQKSPYIFYFGDLHPKWALYNRKLSDKVELNFNLPLITDQSTLATAETPLLLKSQWGYSSGTPYPSLPSVAGNVTDTFNWQASKMFIGGLRESSVKIPSMRVIPVQVEAAAEHVTPGSAEKYSSINLFEDIPATDYEIGYLDCSYPVEGAIDYLGQDLLDGITATYGWYGPGRGICFITNSFPSFPRLNLKAGIEIGRMLTRATKMSCVGVEDGKIKINYQFMTQADDSYISDVGMCVPAPVGPPADYTSYTDPVFPFFTIMAVVNSDINFKPYMPAGVGVIGGFPMEAAIDADLPTSIASKLNTTLDSTKTPDIAPDSVNSSLRPVIFVLGFAPEHQIRTGDEAYMEYSAINNKIYAHVTSVWLGIGCYNTITGFVYQRGCGADLNAGSPASAYFIQTNLNTVWSFAEYGLNVVKDFIIQPASTDIRAPSYIDYLGKLNVLRLRIIRIDQSGADIGKLNYDLDTSA